MTVPIDTAYNIGRSLRGMPQPTRGRKNGRKLVGGFDREKDDFYPTPPALTRGLLALEAFDGPVWECACGDGAISRLLAEHYITILFRMLHWRELARAMSFADAESDYEFAGTKTEITKQIGNAVPVRTARALVAASFHDLVS